MIRIVADDKIPFLKGVLEPFADITYLPGSKISSHSLKGADALLIRTLTSCDERLLKGSSVRFIGTATIGTDHIDNEFCNKHSITRVSAPGCNAGAVLQYISAALSDIYAKTGISMGNLTLGIIGAGHIGKKVEILGHALGMKVLVNDPPRERREGSSGFTSISRVLEESDILTLHVPLNKTGQDKSWHLLDRDALSLMKPGAWLINSARGEVVDGAGLIDVLRSRKSLNLILDVWENEPSINIELLCSASLATPHIAGYSWEGKANASAAIVRELSLAFDLPYKDWYPENIPDPAMKTCTIQCNDKPTEEIIFEAISHTYKIRNDDRNLRTFPENFASLRDGYSFRREFSAYQISHDNICTDAMKLLLRLGFFVNPAV